MEKKKITFDSCIRGVIFLILGIGLLILVDRLSGVLLPFFIAWLIAYMLYPLVKFFQFKLRIRSRALATVCALLAVTVGGFGFFILIVPPMLEEFGRVNDLLFTYLTSGFNHSPHIPTKLPEFIKENIDIQTIHKIFSEQAVQAA